MPCRSSGLTGFFLTFYCVNELCYFYWTAIVTFLPSDIRFCSWFIFSFLFTENKVEELMAWNVMQIVIYCAINIILCKLTFQETSLLWRHIPGDFIVVKTMTYKQWLKWHFNFEYCIRSVNTCILQMLLNLFTENAYLHHKNPGDIFMN